MEDANRWLDPSKIPEEPVQANDSQPSECQPHEEPQDQPDDDAYDAGYNLRPHMSVYFGSSLYVLCLIESTQLDMIYFISLYLQHSMLMSSKKRSC